MRARFIYEKFTEEGDPIHDMNIGFPNERNFTDENEFFEELIRYIPYILKKKSIPKDILGKPSEGAINDKYFGKIYDYIRKYWTFNGITVTNGMSGVFWWPGDVRSMLIKRGY